MTKDGNPQHRLFLIQFHFRAWPYVVAIKGYLLVLRLKYFFRWPVYSLNKTWK